MTSYPFDTQQCNIVLENWAYTQQDVDIFSHSDQVILSNYQPNGLWEFVNSSVTRSTFYQQVHTNKSYPRLTFTLDIKRKSAFYLSSIIAPCLLLLVFALAMFWLPPDSGEKVGLGIAILLAFSVYQVIIDSATAATSDSSPILSGYSPKPIFFFFPEGSLLSLVFILIIS